MRKVGLWSAIGLAASMMILVFIGHKEIQPSRAIDNPPIWQAEGVTHTISLPFVARQYLLSQTSPFGVIMYGAVSDAAGLQVMEDAGAKWVTTSFHWASVEPSRGSYDWSSFDAKAQNAQAAGMELFVLFTGNPPWAAALPGGPVTNTQDLVDFVTLMVERYDCDGYDDAEGHPCVRYWSFYAEPDNGDEGRAKNGKGYWGDDGRGYAEMLSKIAPAMHRADPNARVLIGGLAYDYFRKDKEDEEEGGPFVREFLTDTLAALSTKEGGVEAYLDAVAVHYYPISAERWPTIREKLGEVQAIMDAHGAGALPLLCPEMGYWSGSYGPNLESSEEEQARRLVQMFVRGLSMDTRIMSWYKIHDAAVAGSDDDQYPGRTSGLLRVGGSFKPSYYAYTAMTRELAGARYQRPLSVAGVEGYVFQMPNGQEKTVLWSLSGEAHVVFPYARLRLVDTVGGEFDIWDNQKTSPGDWDDTVGQITLAIHENQPFYVEPAQVTR